MSKRKQAEPCGDKEFYIRPLALEDWKIFREIRIEAVSKHPGNFFAKPDDVAQRPDSDWKETLSGDTMKVFGLFNQDKIIGLTGLCLQNGDKDPETGILVMSYIIPQYRGRGLSALFYRARIEWALQNTNLKRLIVSHRENNEPSRLAMVKAGFQLTKKEKVLWPDGTEDWDWNYELSLKTLR